MRKLIFAILASSILILAKAQENPQTQSVGDNSAIDVDYASDVADFKDYIEAQKEIRQNDHESFTVLLTIFGIVATGMTIVFAVISWYSLVSMHKAKNEAENLRKEIKKLLNDSKNKVNEINAWLENIRHDSKQATKLMCVIRDGVKVGSFAQTTMNWARQIADNQDADKFDRDWANGMICLDQNSFDDAMRYFNNLLEKSDTEYNRSLSADTYVSIFAYLADCCYKFAEHTENIEQKDKILQKGLLYLNSYLALYPIDPEYWSNKEDILRALNKPQDAVVCYNNAILLNEKDDVPFNNRGLAHEQMGDRDNAIIDFNQALALNPNSESAKNNKTRVENTNNIRYATR